MRNEHTWYFRRKEQTAERGAPKGKGGRNQAPVMEGWCRPPVKGALRSVPVDETHGASNSILEFDHSENGTYIG